MKNNKAHSNIFKNINKNDSEKRNHKKIVNSFHMYTNIRTLFHRRWRIDPSLWPAALPLDRPSRHNIDSTPPVNIYIFNSYCFIFELISLIYYINIFIILSDFVNFNFHDYHEM